ncbi:heavy-metal-associated domain-containing protein [Rubritalea tangerina]|uniref:Heavy-metal-associated domain-containing protein n=1 Tax=Rubritalea tangerina TaxID=430798 RepID=A0ABW4ZC67_9BACT
MKIKMTLLAASAMVSFAGIAQAEQCATSKKCKTACDSQKAAACEEKCETECADKCDSEKAVAANTTHFNVSGMTCGGCSKKLTTALAAVKGVKVKKVCHKSGCVDVVLSDGATADQVKETITKAGFKITPEQKKS